MYKLSIILLFIFISLVSCTMQEYSQSITDADKAYNNLDLSSSREILFEVIDNVAETKENKILAYQKLAIQEWKFWNNYNSAVQHLASADSLSNHNVRSILVRSRIERENGNFTAAINHAEKAIAQSANRKDNCNSRILLARAVYEKSTEEILSNKEVDHQSIDLAGKYLKEVWEIEPGNLDAEEINLGLALITKNGSAFVNSWYSYFQLNKDKNDHGILTEPGDIFNSLMLKIKDESLSQTEKEKLIIALADSRLYDFAKLYFKIYLDEDSANKRVNEIIAFSNYLQDVEELTVKHYQEIAIGEEDADEYIEKFYSLSELLWEELNFNELNPEFDRDKFAEELDKKFGTCLLLGSTGNYSGTVLIMGHKIKDERRVIEQYGYTSEFGFMSYDFMVSNGYSSWFWDGKMAIGGWATDTEMVQVREAYKNGPFSKLRMIADSAAYKENLDFIEENVVKEEALIEEDPDCRIPGVIKQLELTACRKIYDSLKTVFPAGAQAELAFLNCYVDCNVTSTVFAHEGRHSIDAKYFPDEFDNWSSAEREYRAKISQIVFSLNPRLALAEILGVPTGDSGHGISTRRLRNDITMWMHAHKNDINGLDETKHLLTQVNKLTNGQILECMKSIDPIHI